MIPETVGADRVRRDRADRDHHRELGSVAAHAADSRRLGVVGGVPARRARSPRYALSGSWRSAGTIDRRGLPDDLGRGPAEHRLRRGVERRDRATPGRWSGSLRPRSRRRRGGAASLRCASSFATGPLAAVCSARSASARSLRSPIAPAIRIAIANTNAPRKPIVCACERLRNEGIQPSNTMN